MRVSQAGLAFITKEEGFVPTKYLDPVGYPTIGVGHLLRPQEIERSVVYVDGNEIDFSNGLTPEQVMALLRQDARWAEDCVNDSCVVQLAQHQFDALVSFVFNVGPANFAKSTLLRRVNSGDHWDVPRQLGRWVYARGVKLPGLVKRRANEGRLFQDGTY